MFEHVFEGVRALSKLLKIENLHIPKYSGRWSTDLGRLAKISCTLDHGIYLGARVLHERANKEIYAELIERFDRRLAEWTSKCFSLVGGIALAKSVMNVMHVYQMWTISSQFRRAPSTLMRRCIWGGDKQGMEIHLVDWKSMCKPIKLGCAKLKQSWVTNLAIMEKLGWRMLSELNMLWNHVLQAKFGCVEGHGEDWKS